MTPTHLESGLQAVLQRAQQHIAKPNVRMLLPAHAFPFCTTLTGANLAEIVQKALQASLGCKTFTVSLAPEKSEKCEKNYTWVLSGTVHETTLCIPHSTRNARTQN